MKPSKTQTLILILMQSQCTASIYSNWCPRLCSQQAAMPSMCVFEYRVVRTTRWDQYFIRSDGKHTNIPIARFNPLIIYKSSPYKIMIRFINNFVFVNWYRFTENEMKRIFIMGMKNYTDDNFLWEKLCPRPYSKSIHWLKHFFANQLILSIKR